MKTLVIDENVSDTACQELIEDFYNPECELPKYIMGRSADGYAECLAKVAEVDGFIDDFTDEDYFLGKPIVRSDEIGKDSLVVVCSTVRPLTAIRRLSECGIERVTDYTSFYIHAKDSRLQLRIIDTFKQAFYANRQQFEYIFSLLNDRESKQTFSDLVNYRLSGNRKYMEGYTFAPTRQYFDACMMYSVAEVFVDAGGFDGQTTKEFIRHCPNFKRVYFFEPEEENMRMARANLKDFDNIVYLSKGMSNAKGKVSFEAAAGSASSISPSGTVEIEVDTLDHLVDEAVTFIKMDIEGAEALAVEGCREHIAKDHPKLAIAAYHKVNDFWELPQQILSIRSDYDIYLRHYTEGTDETIMYFVPISDRVA
ncbi:MAG: FkbM family methyltransferase [Candidatus Thiodiazotropha sp.]